MYSQGFKIIKASQISIDPKDSKDPPELKELQLLSPNYDYKFWSPPIKNLLEIWLLLIGIYTVGATAFP